MPGSLLSRAAVLPQVPPWSRVFRAGYGGKGETAAVCELVGITGPSATPLPSPFICTVKNSPGYLNFLFNSLCIFTFFFFSFVPRRAGELLDGKQSGCQDKVFCRIRGLFVGVFFSQNPISRAARAAAASEFPTGFYRLGKMRSGAKIRLGLGRGPARGFFLYNNN